MPHIAGRTDGGYSNNWWDYLYTPDYCTDVYPESAEVTIPAGDTSDGVKFTLCYNSGARKTFIPDAVTNYLTVSSPDIIALQADGTVKALTPGTAAITLHFDGHTTVCTVTVE